MDNIAEKRLYREHEKLLALLAANFARGGAVHSQRAAGLLPGHNVSQPLLCLLHKHSYIVSSCGHKLDQLLAWEKRQNAAMPDEAWALTGRCRQVCILNGTQLIHTTSKSGRLLDLS